jgi:hypothetical protein
MGIFFSFIAPPFRLWQCFVSTLWCETVRDVEELVARGKWRIRCTYPRVFRRSPLSYGTSDSVGIIWLWDRWRKLLNKKLMYCSSGEIVEEDFCCAVSERRVCKKGRVSWCLWRDCTNIPCKFILFSFYLVPRNKRKIISGQEINFHFKGVS